MRRIVMIGVLSVLAVATAITTGALALWALAAIHQPAPGQTTADGRHVAASGASFHQQQALIAIASVVACGAGASTIAWIRRGHS